MMDTDGTMTLTADDVAALRKANRVAFQTTSDGVTAIRAILDKGSYSDQVAVYTAREQRLFPETRTIGDDRERTIRCQGRCTDYGDGDRRSGEGYTAFHLDMFAHTTEWQSIAATLRAGDTVTLHWVASNNSDVTRGAGFVRDELRICFGAGSRTRTFLVDVQVGPRNSARMVKPAGMP
jgi:hypothetical protein